MSMMRSVVGLNKSLASQSVTRMLATGARGFHAAAPLAVSKSNPRSFGGPLIHPGGSYIKDTVNEPTEYPKPSAMHGSIHWAFERLIAASIIPMFAVATVKHGACGVLDATLSATLILHSHIGFDACLTDYLDKRKYPFTGPLAKWIIRAATVGAAVGLYGLTELVARAWVA
ncbi:succinate dehydrogenase [Malassezia pachydermatis]|uniref:Succinate dehydrogenase [ubiquinone] cytochrome b small subunit n=1 Tax=Malassezia pachydermatis TaxID=77020 RepID=A0A0M8MYM2_9BASI|nr:succinate dehydrogenase [Malassezia pachydermatis]KOS16340.1 succinate dehydrogenase [Malassezia pachydermatis]